MGAFGQIKPTYQVALPIKPGTVAPDLTPGVEFAAPPLPNEIQLKQCAISTRGRDAFFGCVVDKAMPAEYRLTKECIQNNQQDAARALLCSSGRTDVQQAYDKCTSIKRCSERAEGDNWKIAQCVGDNTLGSNEAYYLGCVTKNRGDVTKAAVCGLAKDLNAEQQIALACAMTTGAEPVSFATCTGGQLLERELNKCLEHGIATDQGCFGPNNEYRKFLQSVNDQAKRAFGENSVAYQAWNAWQNNVLAPGPNHVVVHHLNNAIKDVTTGPGPNNTVVVVGKTVENTFKSIGKVFGF